MTRDQQKRLWAIALAEYGTADLEQLVRSTLAMHLDSEQATELPNQVSADGLAELVGILLLNIETGERPLLGALRTMNRLHFRVLRQLCDHLTCAILANLPIRLVPKELLRLRSMLDLGL
jgi:hypothetical protein